MRGSVDGPIQHASSFGRGSFFQGFLASFAVCGMAGALAFRYFQRTTGFGPDFSSFPAHMQSSSARISDFHPAGVLKPSQYRKYRLRQKTELADGIFKFVFDLPTKHAVLGLPIGQHIAIRATIDDHTVVRSYTPVSNNRDLGRFELLVRVYPQGQVGNYLKSLQVGDLVDIRGPKGTMRYRKGWCKAIGMVGGGTGITPLFQIIRAICEDATDDTQVTLVYGNRSEADILLKQRLDHYANSVPDKFKVVYTLDQPPPGWEGEKGYPTKELLRKYMPEPTADNKVLLCGPPPMVNATKDNLVAIGFNDSGTVSKMTDQIYCF